MKAGCLPHPYPSPQKGGEWLRPGVAYERPVTVCAVLPDGLGSYLFREVLPRYALFDAAHRQNHALSVLRRSLQLGVTLGADPAMLCVVALFHDLGLCEGRASHHLVSGRILREDTSLRQWFGPDQIELMAQATEDHRASASHEPRSLYGRIVAEADRLIIPELIMERTLQYGLDHYPELSPEEHVERALRHLHEKYGPDGYLRLWIPGSENERRLHQLWAEMRDEDALRRRLTKILTKTHPHT